MKLQQFDDNQMSRMSEPKRISPFHHFEIPHQFTPELTIYGACVEVFGTLSRIFFGCVLGGVWGAQMWVAGASAHSLIWKVLVISGYAAGLGASLWALMWVVGKATMKLRAWSTSSSARPGTSITAKRLS